MARVDHLIDWPVFSAMYQGPFVLVARQFWYPVTICASISISCQLI